MISRLGALLFKVHGEALERNVHFGPRIDLKPYRRLMY